MDSISSAVWFPVVTLVVGLVLKAVFDSWTENRKAGFDRESRVERRKEVLLLQRIDLQRKALGDLQIAIADMMRSTSMIQTHDLVSFHETGEWGQTPAPESLDEVARSNFRAVSLMKVRVSDAEIREMTSELSSLCANVTLAASAEIAEDDWRSASTLYVGANERIGDVLRSLEHQEQAFLS
ncbi:hypothetical protein [Pseudomonas khavaziana]|uniref:hypothetical protein n=1 Tax=Pseudomonas khavaziana TaxID=2842351 RepID=UPI001C3E657D|nr:hypothetical protein [Pseudomonas khavaziana]MBV4478760.1 hypothetical protein [Pseudomonas khavaziana]